jgi:hypothetical protein
LPFGVRMAAGTSALLVLIGGGAATVAIMTKDEPRAVQAAAGRGSVGAAPADLGAAVPEPGPEPAAVGGAGGRLGEAVDDAAGTGDRTSSEADRTATRKPRQPGAAADPSEPPAGTAAAVPPPAAPGNTPAITTQTISETRPIPYGTRLVRDPAMPRGEQRVETEGIDGEQTLRWLVTFAGGRQTERRLIDSTVTREPQHRVIAFGSQGMRPGRGPGRGPGQWPGRGHRRECGKQLGACLPLGRSACPTPSPAAGSPPDQPKAAQKEPAPTEAARTTAAQTQAARTTTAQTQAARTTTAQTEAARTTAAQTGAARTKAAKTEAARATAAQTEAARATAAQTQAGTTAAHTKGSATPAARADEDAVQRGGSIMVTDEDLELLTPEDLQAMGIDPGLLCS